jgi:starch-binding outer membrane protein, SusD/RagB family
MKKLLYIIPVLLLSVAACKKDYLETQPTGAELESTVYSRFAAVQATLSGLYKTMYTFGNGGGGRHDDFGQKAVDLSQDLMGNDMVVHTLGYGWFNASYNYTEYLSANASRQSDMNWVRYYSMIKQANILIKNVDNATDATVAQRNSVKGQALGMRAYAYFSLINYYQQAYKGNETKPGVPIYTQDTIVGKARGTVQDVYNLIISDLTTAEGYLTGVTRANKSEIDVKVIQGLRARTALLMEDWATAANFANKARTGFTLMTAAQYTATSAFSSAANPEWIWGSIIPASEATIYASFFSHIDIRTGGYAALGGQKKITKALYDMIPAGDIRKSAFKEPGTGTTSNPDYNQLKHQVPTAGSWAADYLYMRAAEMYLIEAEALARQGQDGPAATVLQTLVQTRYPAYSAAGLTGAALLNEIYLQRRIELWGEGFSLMDIKRLKQPLARPTGAGNHGSPNFDPGVYTTAPEDARMIMRIPQRELDNNSSMTPADQNP